MNTGRTLAALCHGLRGLPVAAADWTPILAAANRQLLAPALWVALRASGRATELPADVCDYLATLHRLNGDRNRALRRQAIELIGALNRSGIRPALLKGAIALFDGPYADPATRMMRDLDILIPGPSRTSAIEAIERLGYVLVKGYGGEHHAFGDFARPHDPGSVDLHTELVDPAHLLSASEVWSRGEPRETGGVHYITPCPTDRVLHNLLHAQIHHLGGYYRGELEVQQVFELAMLSHEFGSNIDWRFIENRMRSHRLATPLGSYLLAAQDLFGLAWPLMEAPDRLARLHYRRCKVQWESPALRWLGVPWGNLRSTFAWHRMRALHGAAGGPLTWRLRHVAKFVAKKGIGAGFGRLLRVH